MGFYQASSMDDKGKAPMESPKLNRVMSTNSFGNGSKDSEGVRKSFWETLVGKDSIPSLKGTSGKGLERIIIQSPVLRKHLRLLWGPMVEVNTKLCMGSHFISLINVRRVETSLIYGLLPAHRLHS